jgi:hypothetical protein
VDTGHTSVHRGSVGNLGCAGECIYWLLAENWFTGVILGQCREYLNVWIDHTGYWMRILFAALTLEQFWRHQESAGATLDWLPWIFDANWVTGVA